MSMRHINVKEPPTMAGKLPLLTSTPMMRKNMSPPSRITFYKLYNRSISNKTTKRNERKTIDRC